MVQAPREPDGDADVNDDTKDEQDADELDRFRDLARKLVRVPKPEIDVERAKEEGRKEPESGG
jgi:hypothetical protein